MSYNIQKRRNVSRLSHCHFTYCLVVTLSIVPLCLLSRFLANNNNGKLSLNGYFVYQQSVIQHLWRWRAPSVNVHMIWMLNSWPLRIAPVHSRVGGGCYGENQLAGCGTPEEEKPQSGGNHWRACCVATDLYAILCKMQPSSLFNCSTCLHKVRTYI